VYISATDKRIPGYAYFAPQNLTSPIMQASLLVSMETIQVRLRLELFGLYQFRAISFSLRILLRTATTCAATTSTFIPVTIPTYPPLWASSYVTEQSYRLLRRNRRIWENMVIGSNSATLLPAENLAGT